MIVKKFNKRPLIDWTIDKVLKTEIGNVHPDEYKPHYMYKGKSKIYAKKPEDHEKLKKKGYDHDDPTTKKDERKIILY